MSIAGYHEDRREDPQDHHHQDKVDSGWYGELAQENEELKRYREEA